MLIPSTHLSLLNALNAGERQEEAWTAFHDRYRDVIFNWCRRRELPPEPAEDLTQEVLLKLFQELPRQAYDPAKGPFRSWLKVLVNNAVTDHWRRQQRRPDHQGVGGSAFLQRVEALTTPEATAELGDAIEQRARTTADEVLRRVRVRVEETTWQAFYQKKIEQCPVAEIAARLGLSVCSIYKATQRVKQLLLQEYHNVQPTRSPPSAMPGCDDAEKASQ
jgi:RNA polymerase sigma factor (sigma-70 family)